MNAMNHVMGNQSANDRNSSSTVRHPASDQLLSVQEISGTSVSKNFAIESNGFAGQPWLVEERDACGVGFIADQQGRSTHDLVQKTLMALGCMEHRGGCSADQDSGDGAGVMLGLPWDLLNQWAVSEGKLSNGKSSLTATHTGVAMIFLPQDEFIASAAKKTVEEIFVQNGLTWLGWRNVPINSQVLGRQALENLPGIIQAIVTSEKSGDEFEQQLYIARKKVEKAIGSREFYFCSCSSRTIVYKGMVRSEVLGAFYSDLQNIEYTSSFSVYHRRFSTNTLPKWPLAQPMRLLGHNGEINTLLGNINWTMAKESSLSHPNFGDQIEELKPIVNAANSDSATLDNVCEVMVRAGRSPMESLMIMVDRKSVV